MAWGTSLVHEALVCKNKELTYISSRPAALLSKEIINN